MTSHLSDLTLDELLAGLPPQDTAAAHLAGCEACERRQKALALDREEFLASPLACEIRPVRSPIPFRRKTVVAASAALAIAAVLTIGVRRASDEVTPKGSFGLRIVRREAAPDPSFTAHPGEAVSLTVSALGHPYALVLGVEATGGVQRVWPPDHEESGRLREGSSTLSPPFRVTPGSLALHAFFSDSPIDAALAIRSLQNAIASDDVHGEDVFTIEPPVLPNEKGRAKTLLRVLEP